MRAGLILMMDRTFTHEQNAIMVEKAIRYAPRGVVGVDIAGPRPGARPLRLPRRSSRSSRTARDGGLGVTIHVGEEGFPDEIGEVVEHLRPDRIGHGILAAGDPELVPPPARHRHRARDLPDLEPADRRARATTRTSSASSAPSSTAACAITVSTDGPEMMRTHLRDEFDFLCRIGALSPTRRGPRTQLAHEVSFGACRSERARRRGA